jgi:signal peptidase I
MQMARENVQNKNVFIVTLSFIANLFWTLLWIVTFALLILRIFVFQQVNVVGVSMQPNYFGDEQLIINQIDRTIQRGQVVAVYRDNEVAKNANYFTRFDQNTVFFLKRVIGLPGEELEIIDGKVIIYNERFPEGVVLIENYLPEQEECNEKYFTKTLIPEGEYFLMGDNRCNSFDSRGHGPFHEYAILGQETVKFWPLEKLEVFHLPDYKFRNLSLEEKQLLQVYREHAALKPDNPLTENRPILSN